jgi:hypothetical protein
MVLRKTSDSIDLRALFQGLQQEMLSSLETIRKNVPNRRSKGNSTELNWIKMLEKYLPKRYSVIRNAFVLDSLGKLSDEIDIMIFDRQYSPFLYTENDTSYLPAESVYALIEVKPTLTKDDIKYGGAKSKSVRELHRTTVPIPSASGKLSAKELFDIPAGIVTYNSSWTQPFGKNFRSTIANLDFNSRIDFGCSLIDGAFDISYNDNNEPDIKLSSKKDSLITFFMNLVYRLQQIGTVPMIDMPRYLNTLKNIGLE